MQFFVEFACVGLLCCVVLEKHYFVICAHTGAFCIRYVKNLCFKRSDAVLFASVNYVTYFISYCA